MRRSVKRHGDPHDESTEATDEATGVDDPVVVWDDAWAESEEERVARWLRSRIRHNEVVRSDERVRADSLVAPFERPNRDPETYRRHLVAAAQEAEARIEQSRRESLSANAALEAEIRSLEDRRLRLEAGLLAQQAEFEHVLQERDNARSRLDELIADLEAQEAGLEAELAAVQADADSVRTERMGRLAALQDRAGVLEDKRQQLATIVTAEYAEAEAAYQERLAEAATLEAVVRSLLKYRDELAAAVEAEQGESDRARQVQEAEAAQLRAQILDLERRTAPHQPLAEGRVPDQAPSGRPESVADEVTDDGALNADVSPHEPGRGADTGADRSSPLAGPLDPSGGLAEAVAELGRHLASVLEAERSRAGRLGREQEAARARFETDRRALEEQYGALPGQAGAPKGRGRPGRRRSGRKGESRGGQ